MKDLVLVKDLVLAWLLVRVDRLLGPKPPAVPGRNLVGGNREQDFWPLRRGQPWCRYLDR